MISVPLLFELINAIYRMKFLSSYSKIPTTIQLFFLKALHSFSGQNVIKKN